MAFCKVWSRSRWYWPWGFSSWAAVDSEFSWVNWSESQCRWGSHRVVVFTLSLPEGKLLASRLGCCCPSLRLFRCSLWSLYRLDFANKADYFTAEEMLLLHLYDAPQRHLLKSMHCQNLGKLYNNLIPLLLPELLRLYPCEPGSCCNCEVVNWLPTYFGVFCVLQLFQFPDSSS